MITELRIQGFKCFVDQTFAMKPLTVLTGLNGVGKSTVIQALLLIEASAETRVAHLNGPYGLKLGDATDVVNHQCEPTGGVTFTIRFGFRNDAVPWSFQVDSEYTRSMRSVANASGSPNLQLDYISADRLGPQDFYEMGGPMADANVGFRGEFVAQALLNARKTFVHPKLGRQPAETANVVEQTELWLSEIVRPTQIQVQGIPGTNVITLRFRDPGPRGSIGGEWTRPSNTGFGLTHALPIIVAGLSKKSGLLIVENPESHLHPKGQSKIGEFLARVAASGVQVLVETHSDHVLNGIRRAVAIDRVLESSDVVTHFFDDQAPGHVTTLELKPNGDMSDWPSYFFDQIETDLAALAKVRRQK